MYVIGLDIGTTGTKALIVNDDGEVYGRGYKGYGVITGEGGVIEQNPKDWWNATVHAVSIACKDIDKTKIKAISLSTQGASSVLVDEHCTPMGNALTWMDKRAYLEAEELLSEFGEDYFYQRTGWDMNASLDACKLLWLKKHRPEVVKRAHKFLSTIDYLNYHLVESYVIDPTNAAIRQLADINDSQWMDEVLTYIGVSADLLPAIIETGKSIGRLTENAAAELGLTMDVEVYNGAHDQYCSALGSGSINNGDVMLGTGTAWVVMGIVDKPLFTDSKISPAKHMVPDLWGALASVSCGGISLDWFRSIVGQLEYDEINSYAESNDTKERHLIFYPYFNGAGIPVLNDNIRGTFTGLELRHNSKDMAIAVMEGVAFHTAMVLDEFIKNGVEINMLRVMGGAVKSRFWMNILKSLLDYKVVTVTQTDAAAMGAAMIASVGCGISETYKGAAGSMVAYESGETIPDEVKQFYRDKYAKFKKQLVHINGIYK